MTEHKLYLEEIDTAFTTISKSIKKGANGLIIPSENVIYHYLETYAYDPSVIGKSIETEQSRIIAAAIGGRLDTSFERTVSIIPNGYKTVANRERAAKAIGYNDMIWLHFAIVTDEIIPVSNKIINFLNNNNISYILRAPTSLGPDVLVVGVCSKEEAKLITEYCSQDEEIKETLMCNNPFMPRQNGIGIVKEVRGRSYTHHVAHLLHQYYSAIMETMMQTGKIDDKWATLEDFSAYVMDELKKSRTQASIFDRYLNYQVALGLKCIEKEKNYLENVDHLIPLTFNREKFNSYKEAYKNNRYYYLSSSNEEITEEDNYILWLELQAYNCINRMYFEKHNELPKEDGVISTRLVGILSQDADSVLSGTFKYSPLNYNDTMVSTLYPCMVAYNAHKHKMTTPKETRYIEEEITRKVVHRTKQPDSNGNFYTVNGHTMASTIPPLKIGDCLIGIEYLDYSDNYCNIFLLRNGEKEARLGVFLDDADKNKIWEEKVQGACAYRAALARILANYDNIPFEIITRGQKTGKLLKFADIIEKEGYNDLSSEELFENIATSK